MMPAKYFRPAMVSIMLGMLLTAASLGYESTYQYCLEDFGGGRCSERPAWGFPLAFVFDNDVSSPVMSMNEEDTVRPLNFLFNIAAYSVVVFALYSTWDELRSRT